MLLPCNICECHLRLCMGACAFVCGYVCVCDYAERVHLHLRGTHGLGFAFVYGNRVKLYLLPVCALAHVRVRWYPKQESLQVQVRVVFSDVAHHTAIQHIVWVFPGTSISYSRMVIWE